jgi:hypothetical protein
MSGKEEVKQVNIQIELDQDMAQGMYVNMAVVQHSSAEFVLDFIFIPPGQPKAKVRSRIIMAPEHAKRLLAALRDNLGHYEKRFGEINLPNLPPPLQSTVQ